MLAILKVLCYNQSRKRKTQQNQQESQNKIMGKGIWTQETMY